MIVVTGGAGFIGSAMVWKLNQAGHEDILVVDELGTDQKWRNLSKRHIKDALHKDDFLPWLERSKEKIEAVFHMGACSSTTEEDADYLVRNNHQYSVRLFEHCRDRAVPYIYASSAATYGAREADFSDGHERTRRELRPINKYGFSKHLFDCWALQQKKSPPFWAGLKFFNVYGPNEYHKGPQASVVFHAFPQIRDKGVLKLFKSYKTGIADGDQCRDFVYVKDVVNVMDHLWQKGDSSMSGIYNCGTGVARTFLDLGRATFAAMEKKPAFDMIEMPENIRSQYQYFTCADLKKLRQQAGYLPEFTSLEDGVRDYVQNHLTKDDAYL